MGGAWKIRVEYGFDQNIFINKILKQYIFREDSIPTFSKHYIQSKSHGF